MSGACVGPATLYLTAEQAAAYAGIGINAMRAYMDGATPPPMLLVGTRRYVQRDGLARYLEDKQTWHYKEGTR